MFRLFESRANPSSGVAIATNQRYLGVRAEVIVQNLKSYFDQSSFRLPNDHLLMRVLRSLEFSLETPFEKVVESVYARTLNLAKHFNLTSEGSYGVPHKGVFYSNKQGEVVDYIFANNSIDINPFDPDRSWTDLSPLKVLYHPVTDFRWLLPNGQNQSAIEGYSVVHLDIPLLALQYREYCLEMVRKHQDDAVYNPNKFLMTRVLPKLYNSHFDLLVINQFLLKAGVIPASEPKVWLPMALLDVSKSVQQSVDELYPRLTASRRTFTNSLEMIPSVFNKNAMEALKLPTTVATRQSFWLQVLTRFPMMEFLMDIQGKPGRDNNRSYVSEFKSEMGPFLSSKAYQNFQQPVLEEKFLEAVDRMMNY